MRQSRLKSINFLIWPAFQFGNIPRVLNKRYSKLKVPATSLQYQFINFSLFLFILPSMDVYHYKRNRLAIDGVK